MRLEDGKEEVKLSVSDEGVGIPEDELERIFEWMYRTKATLDIEGSGIGLYIVKMVTELHDGEIDVDSALGKGSTFTVTFPKVTDETEIKDEKQSRNDK